MTAKTKRGGPRPGSGPKPLPPGVRKETYATKLSPDVIAFLRSLENAALTIEETTRRSKAFQEWSKAQ